MRIVGLKRHAASKNCSGWHVAPNLLRYPKATDGSFHTPLLGSNAESRCGHRIGSDRRLTFLHGELLISQPRYVLLFAKFASVSPNDKIRVVMKGYHIAVVGATGAAGTELLRVLERRNFPVASLRAIGSSRSVGKSVRFREEPIPIKNLAINHSRKSTSPFSAQAATFPEIMFRLPASRTRSRLINHRPFGWIRMCRS